MHTLLLLEVARVGVGGLGVLQQGAAGGGAAVRPGGATLAAVTGWAFWSSMAHPGRSCNGLAEHSAGKRLPGKVARQKVWLWQGFGLCS